MSLTFRAVTQFSHAQFLSPVFPRPFLLVSSFFWESPALPTCLLFSVCYLFVHTLSYTRLSTLVPPGRASVKLHALDPTKRDGRDVPFRFNRELLARLNQESSSTSTAHSNTPSSFPPFPPNHLSSPHRLRLVLALRTNLGLAPAPRGQQDDARRR